MKVDWQRERSWWDAKAPKEEEDQGDEIINRALRWREIEHHLDGVKTILDLGCGHGRFAIPLAKRGFTVTCVDISPVMLDIARKKAEGIKNIIFTEGNIANLSQFTDRSFDLVLAMDGAISFCGAHAETAIMESCRVAGKTIIMTIFHRARMVQVVTDASLKITGKILPAVQEMIKTGIWDQNQFPDNNLLAKGCTQDYFGVQKAFTQSELKAILERTNMHILRLGGIGTLSENSNREALEKLKKHKTQFNEFLDIAEYFDKEVFPEGKGTQNRCGLIAVAEPKS